MEDHLHLYQERLECGETRWQQALTLSPPVTLSLPKESNRECLTESVRLAKVITGRSWRLRLWPKSPTWCMIRGSLL